MNVRILATLVVLAWAPVLPAGCSPGGDEGARDAADTPGIPATRCSVVPLPADPAAEQVTVFQGGLEGYPVYRIPAFESTAGGVLAAFAEARSSLSDPGAGLIDVVMKRSLDCGRTWTPLAVLFENGPGDAHNPVAVDVPHPGGGSTLFLFFSRRPASPGGEEDLPPGTGPDSASAWVSTSRDDGATWSAARELTSQVKPPDWAIFSFGPGRGLWTRWGNPAAPSGRLVAPGWFSSAGGVHGSFVILSDDGGDTFRLGGRPQPITNESQVVELNDGTLLMDARQNEPEGGAHRRLFRSGDGGETWSDPQPGLPMAPIMSSVIRVSAARDGDPVDRLAHSGIGPYDRADVRVWTSGDEGRSWQNETMMNHGVAQYSVLALLDDGTIGLVYEGYGITEEGLGPNIVFTRFDASRL